MNSLFSLSFWFNYRFIHFLPFFRYLFIGLVALFFVAIFVFFYLRRVRKDHRKLWSKLFEISWINAVIGLFLLFFYYEEVPFFTARIWFLLWFVEFILIMIKPVKYILRVNSRKSESVKEDTFKKYIP
jgi:hypothetical protein